MKALIFDMDGVIIDSEPFWREAETKVFRQYDIPMTEEMCRKHTGLRIDVVVDYWLQHFGKTNLDNRRIIQEIMLEVKNLIQKHGQLLPGVEILMREARKQNVAIAIASSSFSLLIETVINQFGLDKYVQLFRSSENEEFGKPHPAVYIQTARALGVQAIDCVVLEDSFNGLVAAVAARMKTVAVPDEHNFKDPRFVIADVLVSSLNYLNIRQLLEL
jgi:sugar-phosphatase